MNISGRVPLLEGVAVLSDLIFSLILVTVAAGAAFGSTIRFCRSRSEATRNLTALMTMILGGVYFYFLWDQSVLARMVPTSGMIVLGNWFPVFASILAGAVWSGRHGILRRAFPALLLGVVCAGALIAPLIGDKPVCGENWRGDICLQTTPYTCSPASAATLLRVHGIDATEREMAELCLTHRGTTWMGLFRGLSRKVAGSPWKVEVFDMPVGGDASPPETPAILVARLPENPSDQELRETSGWLPGQAHSVVYLGNLTDDLLIVGDPTVGRELWRRHELRTLWTGRGLRLVPRDAATTDSLLAAQQ